MSEFKTQPSAAEVSEDTSRWRQRVIRLGAFTIGAGLAAMPLAIIQSLHDTRVYDEVGVVPTTLGFSPNGSSLNLGLGGGSLYNDTTRYNIGINATIDGPPSVGNKSLGSLISPSTLNVYAGVFHDPKKVAQGYQDVLMQDWQQELLKKELRLTLEIGALTLALSSIRLKNELRRKQWTAAVMGGALLASSGAAVVEYHQWEADQHRPDSTYSLPSLKGTALAGTVAEYQLTAQAVPEIQMLVERESLATDAFMKSSTEALLAQANLLAAPKEGETAFLLEADMHSNEASITMSDKLVDLMNKKFGDGTIRFVGLAGDSTYGSAAEKTMVDSIGKIGGDTPKIAIRGNHDSDITKKQMEAADITVLNGKTKDIDGISVLGADDPRITKFFEDTTQRGEVDPATADKKLYLAALADHPTLLMLHEAYDLAPMVDIGTISKSSMQTWLNETDNYTKYQNDGIQDIPANLVVYGHWHRSGGQRVVWNDNGSWSVIVELGTGGGAIGTPTLTNFSTPWSPPGQDAVQTIFYTNTESGLVTGMQRVTFRPDGSVDILPRLTIGSPDGQAFTTTQNARPSTRRPATQSDAQAKVNSDRKKAP